VTETDPLQFFLDGASIDPAVAALRPDYRAALVAVSGLVPDAGGTDAGRTSAGGTDAGGTDAGSTGADGTPADPTDDPTEALLQQAERTASSALADRPVDELPHVAAWRDAFRAFGAKPQRTRTSVEALLRRAEGGLPRVNRLTDTYNAISVTHQVPLGGEDLEGYVGSPRLVRADGTEEFDTTAGGEEVVEHPEPGEVVWRDDAGVTCRRWNWRQGRRTQLRDDTTSALFILDALDPMTDAELDAAVDELVEHLRRLGPDVRVARRRLRAS
jgi:DNA/RNA-binding domain of Phe-tRNA-synthetase-like protein